MPRCWVLSSTPLSPTARQGVKQLDLRHVGRVAGVRQLQQVAERLARVVQGHAGEVRVRPAVDHQLRAAGRCGRLGDVRERVAEAQGVVPGDPLGAVEAVAGERRDLGPGRAELLAGDDLLGVVFALSGVQVNGNPGRAVTARGVANHCVCWDTRGKLHLEGDGHLGARDEPPGGPRPPDLTDPRDPPGRLGPSREYRLPTAAGGVPSGSGRRPE